MNRAKFQHYVPRFYLENFRDLSGKVCVYDKHLDNVYWSKPEKTGGETYYYDVPEVDRALGRDQSIEKFFCEMEGMGASILRRWLTKLESGLYFRIYPEEREIFARFLAVQLVRTPSHRTLAIQTEALFEEIHFKAFLETNFPEHADKPFEMHLDKSAEPLVHARSILNMEALEECVTILQSHIWVVNANQTLTPLLTSDNPVTLYPHKRGFGLRSFSGYGSQGIQVNFPLSPGFSLSLLERTYFRRYEKLDGRLRSAPMLPENVEHENSLQVLHSSRFLFSPRKDFEMAREMCGENAELRDPNKAQFQTSNPEFENIKMYRKNDV